MSFQPQTFSAPDGTEMVILPAADYARLKALADGVDEEHSGRAVLTRVSAGEGAMPAEVLASILDEDRSPLAAWRRYRGLTQAALARKAGLSQVWIGRIEAGGGYGSQATRKKLADALSAPLWALDDPAA